MLERMQRRSNATVFVKRSTKAGDGVGEKPPTRPVRLPQVGAVGFGPKKLHYLFKSNSPKK